MHCHLDRYPNPAKVAGEAEQAGVGIVAITVLPSHFSQGKGPASALRNVRLSLGLHPMLAPHPASEKELFEQLAPSTSYIGEVGLDFSKQGIISKQAQIESFECVLKAITGQGKVISIHSRGAEEAVLERLRSHHISTAAFHWFSGNEAALSQIIEAGHYVSVNGAMLASRKLRALLHGVPRTGVLLETDGPYTKTGTQTVRPAHLRNLLPELSLLWNIPLIDVEVQIARNFRTMIERLDAEKSS